MVGNELLARFRTAGEYGVRVVETRIERLARENGGFIASDATRQWRARHAILATGVVDRLPELEGVEDAIATGAVRLCAICDGYEARDDVIGVLAPAADAVAHAEYLRTFSRQMFAVDTGTGDGIDVGLQRRAEASGICLCPASTRLALVDGADHVADGGGQRFDTLYPVLGADAQSGLGALLGTECDDVGELVVDEHMQTSVDGLYAIGDVVSALNQISVAVGHAAIAAATVHRRLPANYR